MSYVWVNFKIIDTEVIILVLVYMTSRLNHMDYCNALVYELPDMINITFEMYKRLRMLQHTLLLEPTHLITSLQHYLNCIGYQLNFDCYVLFTFKTCVISGHEHTIYSTMINNRYWSSAMDQSQELWRQITAKWHSYYGTTYQWK